MLTLVSNFLLFKCMQSEVGCLTVDCCLLREGISHMKSLCVGGLKHMLAVEHKNMVLWVFGYGSLLWKAGFEYDEKIIGYIKGYRRVFYQGGALSHTKTLQLC